MATAVVQNPIQLADWEVTGNAGPLTGPTYHNTEAMPYLAAGIYAPVNGVTGVLRTKLTIGPVARPGDIVSFSIRANMPRGSAQLFAGDAPIPGTLVSVPVTTTTWGTFSILDTTIPAGTPVGNLNLRLFATTHDYTQYVGKPVLMYTAGPNSQPNPTPVTSVTVSDVEGGLQLRKDEPFSRQLQGSTTSTDKALTWTRTVGAPPSGITLSASGLLSGTPTTIATSGSFTVRATDVGGYFDESVIAFQVLAPLNLVRNPALRDKTDWESFTTGLALTSLPMSGEAKITGANGATRLMLRSNAWISFGSVSGYRNDTDPVAGQTFEASVRASAVDGGMLLPVTLDLMLGTDVVLGTVTAESTSTTGPAALLKVKGTIPSDYAYSGKNGLSLRLSAYPPATSTAPALFIGAPSILLSTADPKPVEPEVPADPGTPETPTLGAPVGELVAAFVGRAGDTLTIAQATVHALIVAEYVKGYTRGRGFVAGVPVPGLLAVIVSATSRLTANPEQVSYYQANDYSERPAVLAGWTLPELAVLNGFRRRTA